MYDSKTYWNNRPNPNKGTKPEDVDRKFIPRFLTSGSNLIELGCGTGRMFEFYKGFEVTGVDFAEQYSKACFDKANEHGLKYRHIIHNVHERMLPFGPNEFDKGLLIKVLLHANPEECKTILKEMGHVCKEVLLISYNGTSEGLAPHCFSHDYEAIIKDLGFKINELTLNGNQIIINYACN
jgi:SAM-dependent methyltransferase